MSNDPSFTGIKFESSFSKGRGLKRLGSTSNSQFTTLLNNISQSELIQLPNESQSTPLASTESDAVTPQRKNSHHSPTLESVPLLHGSVGDSTEENDDSESTPAVTDERAHSLQLIVDANDKPHSFDSVSFVQTWADFSFSGSSPSHSMMLMNNNNTNSSKRSPVNNYTMDSMMPSTSSNQAVPVLPSLGLVDDPLHFLKNQEILLLNSLQKLTKEHKHYLSKGSKRLLKNRKKLLDTFHQLFQVHQSMKEVYNSDKYSKLRVLDQFKAWEDKKTKIIDKIDEIENHTDEGRTYKILYDESVSIDNEIRELEARLKNLKGRQKLVNHQLMENKSLLYVKLNGYLESLDEIESRETTEINFLSSDKSLAISPVPGQQLSPEIVIKDLSLQVNALDDLILTSKSNEDHFNNSFIYLSDTFENILKLEFDIKQFLREGRTELIHSNLQSSKEFLDGRLTQIDNNNLIPVKRIITDELITISKALKIMTGESEIEEITSSRNNNIDSQPVSLAHSRQSSQEQLKLQNSQGFVLTQPSYALPSTTAANITSVTPSSLSNSITGAGNIKDGKSTIGSILRRGSKESRERKYSLTAQSIKSSKGEKKD